MKNTVFAMLVCAVSSIAAAQVTVVRAGRLVEPDSGTVLTDQVIVVDGGKIQAVGKGLAIPAGAKIIDLSDESVLPGFIDCHTHLVDGLTAVNGDPFNVVKKTTPQIVLEALPNAEKTLLSGFTSVRDVGVYRALTDIALRDAIARGDIIGPRMYVAGAYITITGGAGAMTGQAPDIQLPWDLHYGEANNPWEVRQKVRLLAHNGVDQITSRFSQPAQCSPTAAARLLPNSLWKSCRLQWRKRTLSAYAWRHTHTVHKALRMQSVQEWLRSSMRR
jgi:imidazolonepropionase-like amidohydrolase